MINIRQNTSPVVCGPERVGQWWCSNTTVIRGESISRYLQVDGTWGQTSHWFDSEEQIQAALKLGHQPDFTISKSEQRNRDTMQAWMDSQEAYEEERDEKEEWY